MPLVVPPRLRAPAAAALALALSGGEALARTDAQIHALIDALRPVAAAVVIDGDDADWGPIPAFADAPDDGPADPGREILGARIAPLDQSVRLYVATAAAPTPGTTFGVILELLGGPAPDLRIDLDLAGTTHTLTLTDELGNVLGSGPITGLDLAVGAAGFELDVPYAALLPHLPPAMAAALDPGSHRSWVRAAGFSLSAPATVADLGPAVTSYRLIATPYPLDPPLPTSGLANPNEPPIDLSLPLIDEWFVIQGADGAFSHGGDWAWDFARVDAGFLTSDPENSADNADYFGWGWPVVAPGDGTVTTAVGHHPDGTPPIPGAGGAANRVHVDLGGGFEAVMLHAMQGSVLVTSSQPVATGDPLFAVGNSGFSTLPHLHLEVRHGGTRRVAFEDVVVSLNPLVDPWRRTLARWEPRAGFLVAAAPPRVPALDRFGRAALVALVLGLGLLLLGAGHRRQRLADASIRR